MRRVLERFGEQRGCTRTDRGLWPVCVLLPRWQRAMVVVVAVGKETVGAQHSVGRALGCGVWLGLDCAEVGTVGT